MGSVPVDPDRGRRPRRQPHPPPVARPRRSRSPARERRAHPRLRPPALGARRRPRDRDERQESHPHLRREGLRGQGRQVAPVRPLAWLARGVIIPASMPIYEYRCGGCGKKVTVLTLRVSRGGSSPPAIAAGAGKLTRLMSRFAMVRSDDDSHGRPRRTTPPGLDENDPKSMARWMRKMGKELGEDAGEDFDEMVDELEAGDEPTRRPVATRAARTTSSVPPRPDRIRPGADGVPACPSACAGPTSWRASRTASSSLDAAGILSDLNPGGRAAHRRRRARRRSACPIETALRWPRRECAGSRTLRSRGTLARAWPAAAERIASARASTRSP